MATNSTVSNNETDSTNRGERRTAGNGWDATENTRKLAAVFRSGIFRWIPTTSSAFRQDPSVNHREIPDWNTASMFQVFPVFSCGIR
jgi:hypothetical protein